MSDKEPTCEWVEEVEGLYLTCKKAALFDTLREPSGYACPFCGARIVVVREPKA